MVISKDAEEVFDKLQHPLVVKISQHSKNIREPPQSDKNYQKHTHTHTQNLQLIYLMVKD